jgi:transposase
MAMDRIEVITSVERRRRWSAADKARLVAAMDEPGAVVTEIARREGVVASLLYRWRRELSTRPTRAPVGAACALSVDGGAIGYAATAVVALAVASWRAFYAHGVRSPTRRAG